MKINEGTIDRVVRIVLGVALVVFAFAGPHLWLALVGLVALATGIVGVCPLYRVIGLTTLHKHA